MAVKKEIMEEISALHNISYKVHIFAASIFYSYQNDSTKMSV